MATQGLRILIADDQHAQRVRLEKILNRLAYFRVAPLQSFKEVLTLTHCTCEPFELFDTLLINDEMARATTIDFELFCRSNPKVRNAMIYGVPNAHATRVITRVGEPRQIRLVEIAVELKVRRFMTQIDPLVDARRESFVPTYSHYQTRH